MYYAYILRSENFPDQTYIGSTSDLRKRPPNTTPENRFTPINSNLGTLLRTSRLLKNISRKIWKGT